MLAGWGTIEKILAQESECRESISDQDSIFYSDNR
jgi:hypothetical protein